MGVMPLHLSKVAVGCASLDLLVERMAARSDGTAAEITTRFRPTRHQEIDADSSLYWIIKHRLVARQPILGFRELEGERRWAIRLDPLVIPVRQRAKRVHQGWRYLDPADAPEDLVSGEGAVALPPALAAELLDLALI